MQMAPPCPRWSCRHIRRFLTRAGNSRINEAHYGDADVLEKAVIYERGSKQLEIKVEAFEFGKVEVTVMDQGKPQANVMTVLAATHTGPFKSQMSDGQGRVVLSNVTPGDYELLAIEDTDRDSWYAQSFWDQFGSRAQRVHVNSGSTSTDKIEMIKVERGLK